MTSNGKVWVTDTNDGVEEFVSRNDLITLLKAGVEIEGVQGRYTSFDNKTFEITSVFIPNDKQPVGTVSKEISSDLVADVTPNGELRNLKCFSNTAREIVLGDFCTSIGMCTVKAGDLPEGTVVVFDSRIKSCHRDWVDDESTTLRVDVSKLPEGKVLDSVWIGSAKAGYVVMDTDSRRNQYKCLRALLTGACLPYPYDANAFWDEGFIWLRLGSRLLKDVNTRFEFNIAGVYKSIHQPPIDSYFSSLMNGICNGSYQVDKFTRSSVLTALKKAGASSLLLPCMYVLLGGSNIAIVSAVKKFFTGARVMMEQSKSSSKRYWSGKWEA